MKTPTQATLFPDTDSAPLPPHTYAVPLAPVRRCKSCGAEVIWATTPKGAHVPLSVATAYDLAGQRVARSHYTDCPQAAAWGKRGKG